MDGLAKFEQRDWQIPVNKGQNTSQIALTHALKVVTLEELLYRVISLAPPPRSGARQMSSPLLRQMV